MGGIFSRNAEHIHLHAWSNPRVEEKTQDIPVRMTISGLDGQDPSGVSLVPYGGCELRTLLRPQLVAQKAIVLRILLRYVHNEFPYDLQIGLHSLFPPVPGNDEAVHTDVTGNAKMLFPSAYSGFPVGVDQLVYRPWNLEDTSIRNYAGLEAAILQNKSQPFPGNSHVEVFEESDPLVEFIITRADALNAGPRDITQLVHGDKRYYQFAQEFLQHVREIFKNNVFSEFRYTRFEDVHLHVDLPREVREDLHNRYKGKQERPTLFFVLSFRYLLCSPGDLKLRHSEITLK